MKYVSTRGGAAPCSAAQAILEGLAPDGGLYVPERFPTLQPAWLNGSLSYRDLAVEVLTPFLSDFTRSEIENAVHAACDRFSLAEVVPLHSIGKLGILELYHGPTLAFKDVALTLLPHLMQLSRQKTGCRQTILILTATSGDTGKAALEGFCDVPGTEVVVFFPENGVSYLQKRQMQTQAGKNVHVIGIDGNFDDAQRAVKNMFASPRFVQEMQERKYRLSSANSINLGRLLAQIVYYIYGYGQLMARGAIAQGQAIDILVPSGNFGNILAAEYARRMGLPVGRLICASNDNRVLTDFFQTGEYNARRDLLQTSSPSMDILVSSNLERYLYHDADGNVSRVRAAMDSLQQTGRFSWPLQNHTLQAESADEAEVAAAIGSCFKDHEYLMDPHTAVGYAVYQKLAQKRSAGGASQDGILDTGADAAAVATLLASTASPFKFAGKVLESLGGTPEPSEFKNLTKLSELSGLPVPQALAELETKPLLHTLVAGKENLAEAIKLVLNQP